MDNELKPCPFCGRNADVHYDSGNEVLNKSWSAGCKPCGMLFKESGSNSWAPVKKEDAAAEAKAISRWNSRAI